MIGWLELLGARPFEHDINGRDSISGLGKVGEFKHLPPTLTLQYHFSPKSNIRPYAGIGVNYIFFYDEKTTSSLDAALGGPTKIENKDSAGIAVQLGIDIDIYNDWFFNTAAWYIKNNSTVTLTTGSEVRKVDVDLDPIGLMIGFGKRF